MLRKMKGFPFWVVNLKDIYFQSSVPSSDLSIGQSAEIKKQLSRIKLMN